MLGTPKALGADIEGEGVSRSEPVRERGGRAERAEGAQGNYGRLARSDEYSPGVTVSGRESGHFVQVRWRTENSRVQAGQPLAVQEIAAGPVDGREVERDGTAGEAETEGGIESCRAKLNKTSRAEMHAPHKRWAHVWIRIEVHCWPGCRLLEH